MKTIISIEMYYLLVVYILIFMKENLVKLTFINTFDFHDFQQVRLRKQCLIFSANMFIIDKIKETFITF